jgi:hypothetical protein
VQANRAEREKAEKALKRTESQQMRTAGQVASPPGAGQALASEAQAMLARLRKG